MKTALEICDEAMKLLEEEFIEAYKKERDRDLEEITNTLIDVDKVRTIFVSMKYREDLRSGKFIPDVVSE